MEKPSINAMLSSENKALKEKIKSLQAEVKQLKEDKDDDIFRGFIKLLIGVVILISIYPFFRLGLFLLKLAMN